MLTRRSFVKKTHKGAVVKVVREHYLRDDIWCGAADCQRCGQASAKLAGGTQFYLVIDTNVALHQIDLLEHPAVEDVIVTSVVLQEVRHRALAVYQRLRALCADNTRRFHVFCNEHHRETYVTPKAKESANDRNDRAIRVAAAWYQAHLPPGAPAVLLLSNDADCRRKAAKRGIQACSVAEFALRRANVPELADLVAAGEAAESERAAGGGGAAGRRRALFEEHSSAAEVAAGIKAGRLLQARTALRPCCAKQQPLSRKLGIEYSRHADLPLCTAQAGLLFGPVVSGAWRLCIRGLRGGVEGLSGGRLLWGREINQDGAGHASPFTVGEGNDLGVAFLTRRTQGVDEGLGALRTSRHSAWEGRISWEAGGQDVLISGRSHLNRAMDGDVVAVELLPEAEWQPDGGAVPPSQGAGEEEESAEDAEASTGAEVVTQTAPGTEEAAAEPGRRPAGRVVGILRRAWRQRGYCGALDPKSHRPGLHNLLFVPVDKRLPRIRIQTRQADNLMDKRLVVAVDRWDVDSAYPAGHYVRTLGLIGDKATETDVLLIENDINTSPFTPAVYECVPRLPWTVSEEDRAEAGREDMRDICVCSVDPPGCKDIDDALHARELPNGNWELGVHIADVTRFMEPDSAMDLEAARRGTSVYLVDRRIDMLPKALTEDICSLRADVERLTFSVTWEVTPPGSGASGVEVVHTHFTKAVIRSRAALSYQEAQARIDDPQAHDDITLGLRRLLAVARVLRARRMQAGALQLASPEVKFQLEAETLDPLDVGMYQVRETNQMVEEMMLLANVAVAEKIVQCFPSLAVLRRHATPAPRQFEPLLRAAAAAGIAIDTSSSKALADSLDRAVRANDGYFNKLIRIMTTRCMTQALYFCSGDLAAPEFHHYGLAASTYTHFTSPIRRYADVTVHRLLAASIGLRPLPDSARDKLGMRGVVSNLNERHHNAQMAGRASVELHTLVFFYGRTLLADARVIRVRANALVVFVPKYGIEGPVFLTDKNEQQRKGAPAAAAAATAAGDEFVLDEKAQSVTSKDGNQKYTLFDKVAVVIKVEETTGRRRQLRLDLASWDDLPESEICGRLVGLNLKEQAET
eukprot:jgi/Tetstr1/441357/TSEL_029608.t1